MMEMNGRDNAKCQKSKRRDMDDIFEILNDNRTKLQIAIIFFLQKQIGNVQGKRRGRCSELRLGFLERE